LETFSDKILLKILLQKCYYRTSKKGSYDNHIVTAKDTNQHIGDAFGDGGDANSAF
jgi:hypothetical protein